jgi:hypothetical protein
MHGCLPAEPQKSIFPADSSDIEKSITDSLDSRGWFAQLAHRLWPKKPAAVLQHLVGDDAHAASEASLERQCYRYASGKQEPPSPFLVALLRSSDGDRVLDHLMRGCREPWWQRHQLARAALPAVEQLRQLQLPIDGGSP